MTEDTHKEDNREKRKRSSGLFPLSGAELFKPGSPASRVCTVREPILYILTNVYMQVRCMVIVEKLD
jgi:hypothetical protein